MNERMISPEVTGEGSPEEAGQDFIDQESETTLQKLKNSIIHSGETGFEAFMIALGKVDGAVLAALGIKLAFFPDNPDIAEIDPTLLGAWMMTVGAGFAGIATHMSYDKLYGKEARERRALNE